MSVVTPSFLFIPIQAFKALAAHVGGVSSVPLMGRSLFPLVHLHSKVLEKAILSQASLVISGSLTLFGDRFIELGYFDALCEGQKVLNAGLGGQRVVDTSEVVPMVLAVTRHPGAIYAPPSLTIEGHASEGAHFKVMAYQEHI